MISQDEPPPSEGRLAKWKLIGAILSTGALMLWILHLYSRIQELDLLTCKLKADLRDEEATCRKLKGKVEWLEKNLSEVQDRASTHERHFLDGIRRLAHAHSRIERMLLVDPEIEAKGEKIQAENARIEEENRKRASEIQAQKALQSEGAQRLQNVLSQMKRGY